MDKVLNCAELIKSRHHDKPPIVGARVVLTSIVYKETEKILSTLKDKGYDYVIFKIVRDYESRGLGLKENEADELKKIIDNLKPIDRNFTSLDTVFNYREPVFNNDKCIVNEMGLLANVNADGRVYPNIVEIGQDDFCIGNLHDANLEKIWHGETHRQVKEMSHAKWTAKKCRNCRAIAYNNVIYDILNQMPAIVEKFV
jgi:radical SAM protein with 4Fe4S-binding SPASM domain